jgi:hypothetical protein
MTDQQKLTRELIEAGAIEAMVARDAPAMQLLSEQTRAVSLAYDTGGPAVTSDEPLASRDGIVRSASPPWRDAARSIIPGSSWGSYHRLTDGSQDSGPMSRRGKRGRVRPPSRTMERPVMKSNSGSQSRATTFAISVSVTSRPSGVPAIAARL